MRTSALAIAASLLTFTVAAQAQDYYGGPAYGAVGAAEAGVAAGAGAAEAGVAVGAGAADAAIGIGAGAADAAIGVAGAPLGLGLGYGGGYGLAYQGYRPGREYGYGYRPGYGEPYAPQTFYGANYAPPIRDEYRGDVAAGHGCTGRYYNPRLEAVLGPPEPVYTVYDFENTALLPPPPHRRNVGCGPR